MKRQRKNRETRGTVHRSGAIRQFDQLRGQGLGRPGPDADYFLTRGMPLNNAYRGGGDAGGLGDELDQFAIGAALLRRGQQAYFLRL
jgi:hypothetical protein